MAFLSDIITGLQIFQKYSKPTDHPIGAQLDTIIVVVDATIISREDIEALERIQWQWDENMCWWFHFV